MLPKSSQGRCGLTGAAPPILELYHELHHPILDGHRDLHPFSLRGFELLDSGHEYHLRHHKMHAILDVYAEPDHFDLTGLGTGILCVLYSMPA